MEWLVPFMPLFGALPIAVAAVVIARLWQRRREGPADPAARDPDLRLELEALRRELAETQERLDFAERILAQQRRAERLPDRPPGG